MSSKILWPDNKKFAFTIFDDTDRANLENIKIVYDFLNKLGFKTTKSIWIGGNESENLEEGSINAFDDLISSGNVEAIKLAAYGLKAQYENVNGYEGRTFQGKPPRSSGDVFRSQAEVVEAMGDPKYDRDPAYRQDILEKLDRSDIQF